MHIRQIILILGLVLLLLIPVGRAEHVRNQIRSIGAVVIEPLYTASASLRKVFISIRDLKDLPRQNEALSSTVTELLVENAELKEVQHENSLLRDELKFSENGAKQTFIAARIISRSAFSLQSMITINKGNDDGITTGQAVTLSGAYVGKIISSNNHMANVELITSPNAVTQGQLQNSRMTGIVRGGIRGLILENIPQDTSIAEGENVLTSGLGGTLRAGLLIGTIQGVISKKNDIFQSARIKSAANIDRADILFVEK